MDGYTSDTLLSGVTATTTSKAISILGAKRITLMLTRANHTSGTSAFKVQVSLDEATFVDLNKLIDNVTNTNAQTLTRVLTKTLSSATSDTVSVDMDGNIYKEMRVVGTITTDGNATCKVLIEK